MNHKVKFFLSVVLISALILISFCFYTIFAFQEGMEQMSEDIIYIKEDWDKNNIYPLDSTLNKVSEVIDSVDNNGKTIK